MSKSYFWLTGNKLSCKENQSHKFKICYHFSILLLCGTACRKSHLMIPFMIHSFEVIFIRLIAYIIKIYINGEKDLESTPYLVLILATIFNIIACFSAYFAFKSMKDEESKALIRNDDQEDANYQRCTSINYVPNFNKQMYPQL